jgi:hypothetical protein
MLIPEALRYLLAGKSCLYTDRGETALNSCST